MDDYYLVLGIEPDARPEAIQERFRFLAQAFHPDKYSSPKQKQLAEEEFKKINNAYQILSNLASGLTTTSRGTSPQIIPKRIRMM